MGKSSIVRGGLRPRPASKYSITITIPSEPSASASITLTKSKRMSSQNMHVHPLATPPSPITSLSPIPSTTSYNNYHTPTVTLPVKPPRKQRRLERPRAPGLKLDTSHLPVAGPSSARTPASTPISPHLHPVPLPPVTPTSPDATFSPRRRDRLTPLDTALALEDARRRRVSATRHTSRTRTRTSSFSLTLSPTKPRRASLLSPLPVTPPVCEKQAQPGPFVVLQRLQAGAFGRALAVRDLSTRRVICLKAFDKKRNAEDRHVRALRRELHAYQRVAGSKECLWVMDVHAVFQSDDSVYFAMDLMDCDLLAHIQKGPSDEQIRKWMAQMASGINALHDMGLLHRDLKPENVLVDQSGCARIADLGAAYVHQYPLSPSEVYSNEVIGTEQYMSPEILAVRGLRERGLEREASEMLYGVGVDWWALGCIFFDMLSRVSLFADYADQKAYLQAFNRGKGLAFLRARLHGMTPLEEELLFGLLHAQEDQRYTFKHVAHSGYFWRDGFSEFEGLARRARRSRSLYRPERAQYQTQDSHGFEELDLFASTNLEMAGECAHRAPRELDRSRVWDSFAWISPKGMWSDWAYIRW